MSLSIPTRKTPNVLFPLVGPTRESSNDMPTVRTTINPKKPPKASKKDLARFDALKDREIDYSDIPELGDDFFTKAKKESITARFDADVVQWFKSQGRGYQTKMNTVLRAFYEKHRD
jgi:uncharacterized protein (DUF4415 family)